MFPTVRVFISSTFRDMHAERDLLTRIVFPQLRRRCLQSGIDVVDVDLRWGVPEEEAESGHALQVCLDEIDHSRPFFIGFLGERYGWIPAGDEYSITAREIIHGVLEDSERLDWIKSRSFFYFRSTDFMSSLPEQVHAHFSAETPQCAAKVAGLKNRILNHFRDLPDHIHDGYPCRYAGIQLDTSLLEPEDAAALAGHIGQSGLIPPDTIDTLPEHLKAIVYESGVPYVSGLDSLADLVLENLWQAIQSEYETAIQETPSARERQLHRAFGASRRRHFVGRSELLQNLMELTRSNEYVVVRGAPGSGKTALLSMAAEELRKENTLVIERYVGAGPGSLTLADHRDAVRAELKENGLISPPEDPEQAAGHRGDRVLRNELRTASSQATVAIILDGIDQLHDYVGRIEWLAFDTAWPQNLTVIMSVTQSAYLPIAHGAVLEMETLTPPERASLVTEYLAAYRKRLSTDQIGTLLRKKDAFSPLFLRTSAEELRLYQHFDTLSRKIAHIPETTETLFQYVLERVERETDPDLVTSTMRAIACSRGGITEGELLEYLSRQETVPGFRWAVVHRQLDPYLRETGEDERGLLDFAHNQLAQAVRKRYLPSPGITEEVHLGLGSYYESISRGSRDDPGEPWKNGKPRGFSEAAWHYGQGGANGRREAVRLLTDFPYWMARLARGQREGLVRDLLELRRSLLEQHDGDTHEEFRVWAAFLIEHIHVLRRAHPSWGTEQIFLQRAVEHGDDSPITHQAENWIQQNMDGILWIRQEARPEHRQVSPVLGVLEGHTKRVNGLIQRDDGGLISWSADGTIRFWSQSGRTELVIQGPSRVVVQVALIEDEEILVLYGPRLDVHPFFAVGMKCLERYSTSGTLLGRYASHPKEIKGFLIRHDGTTITWDDDGLVQQWASDGKLLGILTDNDTADLHGNSEVQRDVSKLAIETLQLIHHGEIHQFGEITDVVYLSRKRMVNGDENTPTLASLHRSGEILLWDPTLNPSLPTSDVEIEDDLSYEVTSPESVNMKELYDVIDDTYGMHIETESYLICRGGEVVVWADNNIFQYDVAGETIHLFGGHTDEIRGALECNDGRILSWSNDTTLRLWSSTGDEHAVLHGMEEPASGALEMRSGKFLAWSGPWWPFHGDPFLYLWNSDGTGLIRIGEHDGAVHAATEHTDGTILSWTAGTVYQWTCTGELLTESSKETCRHTAPSVWDSYARAVASGGLVSASRIIVTGHTPERGHIFDLEWHSKAPVTLDAIPVTDAVHLKDHRRLVVYRGSHPVPIQSLEVRVTAAPADWNRSDDDDHGIAVHDASFTAAELAAWDADTPDELLTALGDTLPKDHVNRDGRTLLHFAAERNRNRDIILFLMQHGLDVNARDVHGTTPLLLSAQFNGEETVIRDLLQWGADITVADNDGDTVLHAAVFGKNSIPVIELLLNHGAPVDSIDAFGQRALDYAHKHPREAEVKRLIRRYQQY